jgi:hypothetical protein
MPQVISSYATKRLTQYLSPGLRVLVKFDWHGLGDMIMFQPLYQRMKELYPDVEWHLKGNKDQQYFEETPDAEVDIEFNITFPETPILVNKGFRLTKPEACAVLELGIPWEPSLEFTWNPDHWNTELRIEENCIGMVFQCNSDPSKNPPPGLTQLFWQRVKKHGFTPIEVQFCNPNHNSKNGRCAWVDYSCRDFEPTVENVISVLKQCKGFIGVNTGTFCAATCLKGGHVLHLHTRYHFQEFYKRYNPVPEVDCTDPGKIDWKTVDAYLESCK